MSVTQATKAKVKNIAAIVTCAALVLILFGAALAQWAHTSGGKVQIEDIRFVTEDGGYLRALLYIPQGVSPRGKGACRHLVPWLQQHGRGAGPELRRAFQARLCGDGH